VNPNIDARSHPYISTGLRQSKFGVDIDGAAALVRRLAALPSVEVRGLHFHIGSQMTQIEPIEEATRELVNLAGTLLAEGLPLRFVDLGGGLGIDYESTGVPSPSDLGQRLRPILEGLPLEIVLEPGRSLVAAAGVLLTRVVLIKEHGGKRFVVVDAGMNDLIRPALYEAYHRIEPVVERAAAKATVDVVGPICETGDFLALDRELPEVEVGDLLAIRDAGAYCFSMASNYNMRPRPAEVMVANGESLLVRRRESFDDLVRNEV
jgi:diaminopimelate decarboxylase